MKTRKHILRAALLFFALFSASAGDWYVCLGSFRVAANAEQFSAVLGENRLPNAVTVHGSGTDVLYRVVYDRPFEHRDEARIFLAGLRKDKRIRKLRIPELWICETDPAENAVVSAVPQGEVLQKNEEESLLVSEEKPWSLRVRSYKEEHPAQQSSERLCEKDIAAYVIKTYDDDAYFSFDVHVGAFASPEECAQMEQTLAALGIDDVTRSNYNDIKEKMRRYDEVVQQDDVVFETAENATMPEFSGAVRKCLSNLPANRHFLIESFTIVDFETLATVGSGTYDRFRALAPAGGLRALSKAVYFDDLFRKRVEVSVAEPAEPFFGTDFPGDKSAQFSLPDGSVLHASISSNGTVRTLEGVNAERTLLVKIDAYDFSDDDFSEFMQNAWSDSATVLYPQLRKSLCVLPKTAAGRQFAVFTLSRVKESYAERKNYADWSIPRVGHWLSKGYFLQNGEEVWVGFFDMDYAHNAQKVHRMVIDAREKNTISERNHPTVINGRDAWYHTSIDTKEIAFSLKSFRVCVDTALDSSISEGGLHDFASDLLIWEQ